MWTFVWTSAREENLAPEAPGAVKVGGAEGATCGPRALRAPVTGVDTLDEVGPPGPAWMRLVLSLAGRSVAAN